MKLWYRLVHGRTLKNLTPSARKSYQRLCTVCFPLYETPRRGKSVDIKNVPESVQGWNSRINEEQVLLAEAGRVGESVLQCDCDDGGVSLCVY